MEPSKASFRRFFRWLVLIVLTAILTVAGLAIVAHGADGAAPAPSPVSWLTPEVITTVFGLIASLLAVIQNRKKSTAEKIRDTLILGIEHGSVIAAQTGNPDAVKYAIRARAVAAGIEALLAPRVKALTESIDFDEVGQRADIEAVIRADVPPDNSGADQP